MTAFDIPAIEAAGYDADEVFFRGLAYRQMWILGWNIADERLSWSYDASGEAWQTPTPRQLAWLGAFNAANDAMQRREILPDERGVLYRDRNGAARVLWAFEDTELELDTPRAVCDLITGQEVVADTIRAARHHVYLLG